MRQSSPILLLVILAGSCGCRSEEAEPTARIGERRGSGSEIFEVLVFDRYGSRIVLDGWTHGIGSYQAPDQVSLWLSKGECRHEFRFLRGACSRSSTWVYCLERSVWGDLRGPFLRGAALPDRKIAWRTPTDLSPFHDLVAPDGLRVRYEGASGRLHGTRIVETVLILPADTSDDDPQRDELRLFFPENRMTTDEEEIGAYVLSAEWTEVEDPIHHPAVRLTIRKPVAESFPVELGEPFTLRVGSRSAEVDTLRLRYTGSFAMGELGYEFSTELTGVSWSFTVFSADRHLDAPEVFAPDDGEVFGDGSVIIRRPRRSVWVENIGSYRVKILKINYEQARVQIDR